MGDTVAWLFQLFEMKGLKMSSTLMRDSGARLVTLGDLEQIPAPAPTDTWFPVSHAQVANATVGTLGNAGFEISRMEFALSPDDARFFGTIDLSSEVCAGVNLAVGIRNSTDKTLPIGFCCGERVFVCDNLAFAADITVTTKHTRHGEDRYVEGIANAVFALHGYQIGAQKRIERFQQAELSEDRANSLILQTYERGIVGARMLPRVLKEWREPCHADFRERTVFSLLNCFTEVLKDRQKARPNEAAQETIRLQRFFEQKAFDGANQLHQAV